MPTVEQSRADADTGGGTQIESGSITIGSEANRVLVVLVFANEFSIADTFGVSSVTFGTAARSYGTGTALTQQDLIDGEAFTAAAAFTLVAPSGTGTVQVELDNSTRAIGLVCAEISGADQASTVTDTATATDGSSATSLALGITTSDNNALLIGGVMRSFGEASAGNFTPDGGTTELEDAISGTDTNSQDIIFTAFAKTVASAGAATIGTSWSTAKHCTGVALEIKPAAAGGVTLPIFNHHYRIMRAA